MTRQSHRWTIDSIADHVASVEVDDNRTVRLPEWVLPRGAKEGQVLKVQHELDAAGQVSSLHIEIDHAATEAALHASEQQVRAINAASRKRDVGGDVKF